jgi:hypothetical protein
VVDAVLLVVVVVFFTARIQVVRACARIAEASPDDAQLEPESDDRQSAGHG